MIDMKRAAAVAAVAALALAAGDLTASAQSSLTNGPTGVQPGAQAPDAPGHAYRRQPVRTVRTARTGTSVARRPLTVRRTVAAVEAPAVAPAPAVAGPGTLVTGPLGFASNVISLPFRALNGIFPATGDIANNPLVIIGAPLRAVGDIVQAPLQIVGAPFGGTNIATY